MIEINEYQRSTSLFKIYQLQSQIYQRLFQRSHIFDQFNKQKQVVKLKNSKTISI